MIMYEKEFEEKLFFLYFRALACYGIDAQKWVLVEECGELLDAIAKTERNRSSIMDVITELADVSIMVEQMAYLYGWDSFKEEKTRKLKRLEERLLKSSV